MDAIAVSNLARRPNSEWQGYVLSPSNWNGQASAYRQRNSTQELMRRASMRFMLDVYSQARKGAKRHGHTAGCSVDPPGEMR